MIDLEVVEDEIRVPGLDICNEGLYLIAMAAPFAIEKITGDGTVCSRG